MNESKNDRNQMEKDANSFLVKIQYRQNSSWQGVIQWLNGRKTRRFRSFLELVMLMQEALSSADEVGGTIKFHTWNDREDAS